VHLLAKQRFTQNGTNRFEPPLETKQLLGPFLLLILTESGAATYKSAFCAIRNPMRWRPPGHPWRRPETRAEDAS